ncbi:DUF3108 domain-containing protein [Solemya elarraichensis gill symbiont]|nr:DUF3108 domain-containing protein [Solemya elarraichensis gill symbiont]
MRNSILHPLAVAALFLSAVSAQIQAAERLDYIVKLKGAVTLYSWMSLADATITTDGQQLCSDMKCTRTEVRMSSQNHRLLESLAPTRFLFRSVYLENPPQSLSFEKRQNKSSKKYQPYGYKHSFSVRSADGSTIDRYELASEGDALPGTARRFLEPSALDNTEPMVRKQRNNPLAQGALDRWALIQHLRSVALEDGYSEEFPGTDGSHQLRYRVSLEKSVSLMIDGKKQACWKLVINEQDIGRDKKQPPLYLWISKSDKRLPLQLEMPSDQGRIRFELSDP